ncbi:MAG: pantoate--beta-alanine ligase [Candidatus Firestonebacteria bacterium]|nr:pantoate--beta-alanine ligase [Candidatus Firestonebacteria bacterium]
MKTVTTVKEMRALTERWRRNGKTVALVPTMGALHDGHVSLIKAARAAAQRLVVSAFVNPTQFGPGEDLDKYPRDLKRDARLAANEKADVLFAPASEEIYPAGFDTTVTVGTALTQTMCGLARPHHFQGVTTVVAKLLAIIRPHQAFFGQKDYQQTLVVKRLAADLNTGCEIVVLPTVREADGLAKSSRNTFLSEEDRRVAGAIYQALKLAEGMLQVGERHPKELLEAVRKRLKSEPKLDLEYVVAKNADTLEDVLILSGRVLVAVAVHLGATRLIDNVIVDVPSGS